MKTPEELDQMGQAKWQKGLCHIFADALHGYLEKGEFAAIWVDEGFKHVYVSLDGLAYDSETKGETEDAMRERWRLKTGVAARLSLAKVAALRDLALYDVVFGDTWCADLYYGPHYARWLQEANDTICNDEDFVRLKDSN